MKDTPWFKFFPQDWFGSARVSVMTLEQQGAYVRLLCHCWNSGDCSIPDDDAKLARLSGLESKWRASAETLKECFHAHPIKVGFITNPKMWELWQDRENRREASSRGGAKAQAKRKSTSSPLGSPLPNQLASPSQVLEPSNTESKKEDSRYIKPTQEVTVPMGSRPLGEMPLSAWCDDPEVRRLLTIWGTVTALFETQVTIQLDRLRGQGWDKAKLLRALQAAAETGAKTLYDPSERRTFASKGKDYS